MREVNKEEEFKNTEEVKLDAPKTIH